MGLGGSTSLAYPGRMLQGSKRSGESEDVGMIILLL